MENTVVKALKKWGVVIIALSLLATVLLGKLKKEEPIFESNYTMATTIMISIPRDEFETLKTNDRIEAGQNLVYPFSSLAKSSIVANRVIKNLNLEMNYEELLKMIEVEGWKDYQAIEIRATASDEDLARKISMEFAKCTNKAGKEVLDIEGAKIINEPRKKDNPKVPNESKQVMNITTFASIALALSLFFVLLEIFIAKKSINKKED